MFGSILFIGGSGEVAQKFCADTMNMAASLRSDRVANVCDYMLPDNHPYVKSELAFRLALKASNPGEPDIDLTWPKDLTEAAKKKGVKLSSLVAPEFFTKSVWWPTLSLREQKNLVFCWFVEPDMRFIDITPSLSRVAIVKTNVLTTIVPNARWLIVAGGRFRPILGIETLSMQGMPIDVLIKFDNVNRGLGDMNVDNVFSDLAGNSFSGSIFGAMLVSVVVNLPTPAIEFCQTRKTKTKPQAAPSSVAADNDEDFDVCALVRT